MQKEFFDFTMATHGHAIFQARIIYWKIQPRQQKYKNVQVHMTSH